MICRIDVRDPRFKYFQFMESTVLSFSADAQSRSADLVIDYAHAAFGYYYAHGRSPPPDSPKRMFIHVGMEELSSLILTREKEIKPFSEFAAWPGSTCLYDLIFKEVDRGLRLKSCFTHGWEVEIDCGIAWYETRVCSCTGDKYIGWTYRDIETREVVDFYRPFAIAEGNGWG